MYVVYSDVSNLSIFDFDKADMKQFKLINDNSLKFYFSGGSARERREKIISTSELNSDMSYSEHIIYKLIPSLPSVMVLPRNN